ncbi:MAG: signal peptidase I [Alphaproteobacteria bacterium]|nr:signal peptidase I [Alphaproteobacteria bacterium]
MAEKIIVPIFLAFLSVFINIYPSVAKSAECQEAVVHVSGVSLEPMIKDDSSFEGTIGDCGTTPKHGDLVLFKIGNKEKPFIKVVFGVAGDKFELRKKPDGFNLAINGKIAKNSAGIAYLFSGSRSDMLNLYIKDYNGIIPPDTFLVLGDPPGGTADSTKSGLVHKNDIVGMVPKPYRPASSQSPQ